MSSKLNILESKKLFKEFNYLMSDVEFKENFTVEYSPVFERSHLWLWANIENETQKKGNTKALPS